MSEYDDAPTYIRDLKDELAEAIEERNTARATAAAHRAALEGMLTHVTDCDQRHDGALLECPYIVSARYWLSGGTGAQDEP